MIVLRIIIILPAAILLLMFKHCLSTIAYDEVTGVGCALEMVLQVGVVGVAQYSAITTKAIAIVQLSISVLLLVLTRSILLLWLILLRVGVV